MENIVMTFYTSNTEPEDYEEELTGLYKRFEDVNDDYIRFERIPENERLHANRRICGLMKLYTLLKEPEHFDVYAEHDIIYMAGEDDLVPLTDADILYLTRCGFHYDSSTDALAYFC
jgi:hypothetical protein